MFQEAYLCRQTRKKLKDRDGLIRIKRTLKTIIQLSKYICTLPEVFHLCVFIRDYIYINRNSGGSAHWLESSFGRLFVRIPAAT